MAAKGSSPRRHRAALTALGFLARAVVRSSMVVQGHSADGIDAGWCKPRLGCMRRLRMDSVQKSRRMNVRPGAADTAVQ